MQCPGPRAALKLSGSQASRIMMVVVVCALVLATMLNRVATQIPTASHFIATPFQLCFTHYFAQALGHNRAGWPNRQTAMRGMKLLPSNAALCRSGSGGYNHQSGNRATMWTMPKNTTDEPVPGTPPAGSMPEERLDSWKEIAAYLDRDVTTVQRWEKREGMPVHRHLHDKIGSVYASRAELDTWARSRKLPAALENGEAAPTPAPPAGGTRYGIFASLVRRPFVLALAVAVLLAIGVVLWLQRRDYFWRNPIADARFQTVTDFDGVARDAAVSDRKSTR